MPVDTNDPVALRAALCALFPPDCVSCRPGPLSQDKAKGAVIWYIDARTVMDRLDDVFGPGGWRDEYRVEYDKKMVVCRISCKIGDEWVWKEDVGGESEQPDEGDRHKAGFSDAMKRCAVKWGVGRFLYDIPMTYHNLSERGKFFDRNNMPKLPPQFLPGKAASQPHQQSQPQRTPEELSTGWSGHYVKKYDEAKSLAEYQAIVAEIVEKRRGVITERDMAPVRAAALKAKERLELAQAVQNAPLGDTNRYAGTPA